MVSTNSERFLYLDSAPQPRQSSNHKQETKESESCPEESGEIQKQQDNAK
jgi:hypothetical protein